MKNLSIQIKKHLILTFGLLLSINGFCQTILINEEFNRDTLIYPFDGIDKSYSFKLSGSVSLNSDTSLVRVILTDLSGNNFLIFESYPLITHSDTFNINSACDESCFMEGISPVGLRIDIINAKLVFDSLAMEDNPYNNAVALQNLAKSKSDSVKISNLNHEIGKYKMYWRAGHTSVLNLSFQEKEDFFGLKYNLLGFDYYKGGVFERVNRRQHSRASNTYVNSFNWRDRHGANNPASPYFDGDSQYLTGWITPVEDQGICGTCSIFGATGAVEARLNLYYNFHDKNDPHHFDYDISEQDVWKCGNGINNNILCYSANGEAVDAYARMKNLYRCTDSHYPYDQMADNACHKPGDPIDEIKISGHFNLYSNQFWEDAFKLQLMKYGPFTAHVQNFPSDDGPHYVTVTGYNTGQKGLLVYKGNNSMESDIVLEEGSLLDGTTICLFKNSWGVNPSPIPTWGSDGFGMIALDEIDYIDYTTGPLLWESHNHDPNSPDTDIVCSDEDGDGYYWWGTSQPIEDCKSCPIDVDHLEDCDDSNRDLGPYDESYGCTSNCETLGGTYIISENYPISANLRLKQDVRIDSGYTLTVSSILFMAPGKKITIQKGGKLRITGQGKITSSCNQLWQGIEIEGTNLQQSLTDQGLCFIESGGTIENAVCGIKSIPASLLKQSGAIVNANGAVFHNNRTSVYLTKYALPFDQNLTKFENCLFETTGELSDGSVPLELVRLEELSNSNCIRFKGCTFSETDNLRKATGIKAYNSYFQCIKNGASPTQFNNLLYGVYGSCATTPSPVVTINECNFIDNSKAIYLSALTAPQVTANIFQIPLIDSHFIPAEGYTSYGLYLEACTAYTVEENTFECENWGDQLPEYIRTCGAYIRNSGPYANEIYLNLFSNLRCGVAAYGVNRNGINAGLQIKCNIFNDCGTDIGVFRGSLPLTANIGIKRDQGEYNTTDPAKSAGNVFTSLSFQSHTKDIDNSSGMSIRYNHHRTLSIPLDKRMIPLPALTPNVEIHQNLGSLYSASLSCPSSSALAMGSLEEQKTQADSLQEAASTLSFLLQQNVDGGDIPQTVSTVKNSPIGDAYLVYTDLLSKSPYLSDTSMKAAIEREELLPVEMLRDVLVANPQSAKSDSILNALENRNYPLNDTLMGDIMANAYVVGAKELLELQISGANQKMGIIQNKIVKHYVTDTTLMFPCDSLALLYEKSARVPDRYSLAGLYAFGGYGTAAECELNAIASSFTLSGNLLAEHDMYLSWINLVNRAIAYDSPIYFDSLQLNALLNIVISDANNLFLPSVYSRNALINSEVMEYQEPLIFDNDFKLGNKRKEYPKLYNTETKNGYLKIYPNPSRDYVIVRYRLPEEVKSGILKIFSINGTAVHQYYVNSAKNELIIPVLLLRNGQYSFSLLSTKGIVGSQIILVNH